MPLLTLNGSLSFLQRLDAYIQLTATIVAITFIGQL
ncbi:hypothetical protein CPS_3999 [Colwellia psychrerythraea 34H]|uniref:Uncharacterized protein n=1 Tax=Colwellia psychrerythraea (strain 34H / ATCC BAA-681) TaxID=167879 RepID=Q47X14_COLP3|nr:hypothetical protein CPS_3999 [Colwellia psychrerythraea 34H]